MLAFCTLNQKLTVPAGQICPFVRIVIGNLALRLPQKSNLKSLQFYCKLKLKGFQTQVSDVPFGENDAVDSRIHAFFNLSKPELEKLVEKSSKISSLKIEIYRRSSSSSQVNTGCGFVKNGKLLGCVCVQLDLKSILENNGNNKVSVVQNGWVSIDGSDLKLHMNVRDELDPRFVFLFDGERECSPQVFQVNGNVKQPVFTCKFSFRNSGEMNLRSRSSLSEQSTSTSCFGSYTDEKRAPFEGAKRMVHHYPQPIRVPSGYRIHGHPVRPVKLSPLKFMDKFALLVQLVFY